MSKNRSKFLTKAKKKIFKFKCTRGNVSSIIDETIIYENEIESKKTLKYSPIKLEARHSLLQIRKQTKTTNEYDHEDSNISKLPILVFTPEKNPNKFTSTFADRPPIESFMTEDLTVNSPSISSINYVNSQITDSLITNDSTIIGTEFAYSNILYCSPELNKHSTDSLITEDLTYFSSIFSNSLRSNASNFKTAGSKKLLSMTNNSGEILV